MSNNAKRFTAALQAIARETKKDAAESLNRACRNVAFRAAELTPKADPAEIERELRNDKLALKIVTKRLRSRIGSSYETGRGNIRTIRRVSQRQIANAARQLIAKRKKTRGFMRAGWFASIKALGGSIRGASRTGERAPSLKLGSATPATALRLLATVRNHSYDRLKGKAYGATKSKMIAALDRAIGIVAHENEEYVRKKIEARHRRHSDQ